MGNLAMNQLALKQTDAAEKNLQILIKETPADPTIPKGARVLFTGTMNLTQTAWLDLATIQPAV